ncbi:MAG TPA: efflux RND transporter periplasmic adaptor subunit [Terriglobales bacterium]|jgi:RND family efflux transporter MFP subunit|nr:efflux RND transporter periplasmic adaptor subunit [Terriglobales bacterium]
MDIARPATVARQRKRRRIVYAAIGVVAVALVTMGLSRLKPAAPGVDRSTVWIDTVKRGPMLRQVRGLGTLTPVDIQWIPAATDGRVEKIPVLPGTQVQPNTVLLILTNPQLMQETVDANLKLKAAEADYKNLEAQLESQVLTQKSLVAQANAEYNEARMQAETDQQLNKLGVISDLNRKIAEGKAQQLQTRDEIEQERLTNSSKVLQAQLLAKQAEIEQDRALAQLKQTQVQNLTVRAGIRGVLQEQPLKVGQWVTPGTTLAKVVQPDHLKAELKIPETQAKDIQLNLPASVDTHNGVIAGHVMRIDPAVYNGTVTVDVMLDDPLPPGARPDLSVDGTIDLERLSNVLYVGRPAFGQENSTVGMFVLQPDGKTAVRDQVKLGRSSVNTVEILGGLKNGDQVILSDMSRWDNFDRIRLE